MYRLYNTIAYVFHISTSTCISTCADMFFNQHLVIHPRENAPLRAQVKVVALTESTT